MEVAPGASDDRERVQVRHEADECHERWPQYYASQVTFEGLGANEERTVRLGLARWYGTERRCG